MGEPGRGPGENGTPGTHLFAITRLVMERGLMSGKRQGDSWLEAFKRIRKGMPPPTKVKPGKKGKGVPYRRGHEQREDNNG